jgi:hypothetical protein
MVGKAKKSNRERHELNSVFGLEKVDRWNPIRTFAIQPKSRPMRFLGFSTMKREFLGKKFRTDQRSAARFREVGGALLRSALFAKGGTSKKRPSPHLHKVLTRSNKVNPRTLQTAVVYLQDEK